MIVPASRALWYRNAAREGHHHQPGDLVDGLATEVSVVRSWLIVILVMMPALVAVSACSRDKPGPESSVIAADNWNTLLSHGLAIAPVAGVNLVGGSPQTTSFVGGELHAALQALLPGTTVLAPDQTQALLSNAGAGAESRMRSIRRRLVRETPTQAGELTTIAQDLDQRFLLVVWMDEGLTDGLHKTNLDDLQAFDYSMDVHRFPTDELMGELRAVLLDLTAAHAIWDTVVEYGAEGLQAAEAQSRKVVARARGDAAARVAERLAWAGD